MTANTDSPGARILAGSLRQAREQAGMSLRALGYKLEISYSVLSYWENGRRVPSTEDVASVLTALGVTGERRSAILQMARNAQAPDYLAVGTPGVAHQLNGVLECERTAEAMTEWAPLLIPGLLQTSNYARAIFGASRKPGPQIEQQVVMRAGRRDALTRPHPLKLDAIIGEMALRQRIGDPELMPEQLRHLLTMANWATVTVRVVPGVGDYHPGLMGPFILYEFPTAPAIIYLEHHRTGAFVFDGGDIADYKIARDTITESAMSPERSATLIAAIAEESEAVG